MCECNDHTYRSTGISLRPNGNIMLRLPEDNVYNENKVQSINFREEVKLPKGQDVNDWIAKHLSELINEVSMLFSLMTEFCTEKSCPKMTAGNGYKYLWSEEIENEKGEKKIVTYDLPATSYINNLISWIKSCIDDTDLFPVSPNASYPPNFISIVKSMMKRLFRFYAHIYYHHLHHFEQLKVDAVLNTSFRHFIYLALEFQLVTPDQIEPLRDYIEFILNND